MADLSLVPESSEADISRPTNSDLSSAQYYVVKHDSSEEVVLSGANEKSLGILQNAPNGSSAEKTAIVRTYGLSKGKLAEGVTFGKFLTPTAAGKLEVCDAANEEFIAVALGSGDANDLIAVLICHGEVTASDA